MRRIVSGTLSLSLWLLSGCVGEARSPAFEVSVERACAGLPEAAEDRDLADLRASVESVAPLIDGRGAKGPTHLVGAVVEVRAAPGMTPQWLGRVLRCDTARHAAASCSEGSCPLAPAGAAIEVTPTDTGFALAVRSHELDVARDIARRARVFARTSPPTALATPTTLATTSAP